MSSITQKEMQRLKDAQARAIGHITNVLSNPRSTPQQVRDAQNALDRLNKAVEAIASGKVTPAAAVNVAAKAIKAVEPVLKAAAPPTTLPPATAIPQAQQPTMIAGAPSLAPPNLKGSLIPQAEQPVAIAGRPAVLQPPAASFKMPSMGMTPPAGLPPNLDLPPAGILANKAMAVDYPSTISPALASAAAAKRASLAPRAPAMPQPPNAAAHYATAPPDLIAMPAHVPRDRPYPGAQLAQIAAKEAIDLLATQKPQAVAAGTPLKTAPPTPPAGTPLRTAPPSLAAGTPLKTVSPTQAAGTPLAPSPRPNDPPAGTPLPPSPVAVATLAPAVAAGNNALNVNATRGAALPVSTMADAAALQPQTTQGFARGAVANAGAPQVLASLPKARPEPPVGPNYAASFDSALPALPGTAPPKAPVSVAAVKPLSEVPHYTFDARHGLTPVQPPGPGPMPSPASTTALANVNPTQQLPAYDPLSSIARPAAPPPSAPSPQLTAALDALSGITRGAAPLAPPAPNAAPAPTPQEVAKAAIQQQFQAAAAARAIQAPAPPTAAMQAPQLPTARPPESYPPTLTTAPAKLTPPP